MSIEISACDWDEIRLKADIDRRVKLAEKAPPRNFPQAVEDHKQGTYKPPAHGKAKPHFPVVPTNKKVKPSEGPEDQAHPKPPPAPKRHALLPLVRNLMNLWPDVTLNNLVLFVKPSLPKVSPTWLRGRVGMYRLKVIRQRKAAEEYRDAKECLKCLKRPPYCCCRE